MSSVTPEERLIVLESVARLAASDSAHAQAEAIRLAARYRAVILASPAPEIEAGSELAAGLAVASEQA
ncbi:MAG TPA: hypothetical protein VIY73_13410 [Polyangiaceae bacterium]